MNEEDAVGVVKLAVKIPRDILEQFKSDAQSHGMEVTLTGGWNIRKNLALGFVEGYLDPLSDLLDRWPTVKEPTCLTVDTSLPISIPRTRKEVTHSKQQEPIDLPPLEDVV